jgi:hypothetical protein
VTQANRNKTGDCAEIEKCVVSEFSKKKKYIFLATISSVKSVGKNADIFITSGEERY